MAHEFGLLPLPAVEPTPDPDVEPEAVTDHALSRLGEFLQAVLVEYIGDAWDLVAKNEPIVREVKTHDPKDYDFRHNDLPALYLWREEETESNDGDDLLVGTSQIVVLWVYPPQTQFKGALRQNIFNGFSKAVATAIRNEKDPCWVRDGDEDPAAEMLGSSIALNCGFASIFVDKIQRATLIVNTVAGTDARYPAIQTTLRVREVLRTDPIQQGYVPAAIDMKFTTAEEDIEDALVIGEFIRPVPPPGP
jgi:hypothetical protein